MTNGLYIKESLVYSEGSQGSLFGGLLTRRALYSEGSLLGGLVYFEGSLLVPKAEVFVRKTKFRPGTIEILGIISR